MRRKLLTMVALGLAVGAMGPRPALADAAAGTATIDQIRLTAADELMAAMRMEEQIARMLGPMIEQTQLKLIDSITKSSPKLAADRAQDPYFDERMRRISKVVGTAVNDFMTTAAPSFVRAYAAAHAQYMTVDELSATTAFFRTSAGQSYASHTAEIAAAASAGMVGEFTPAMVKRMESLQPEIDKALSDLPPPPKRADAPKPE